VETLGERGGGGTQAHGGAGGHSGGRHEGMRAGGAQRKGPGSEHGLVHRKIQACLPILGTLYI